MDTQASRDLPGQHIATVSVYNGYQVHEPMKNADIRDIGSTPNLIGAINGKIPQEVWAGLVSLILNGLALASDTWLPVPSGTLIDVPA